MGTPGIAGHRAGRDHSTRFTTSVVDLTTEGDGAREVQRLLLRAADPVADLALTIEIEMLASGLVRTRAAIASTGGANPFTLDAMTLALPVPARAHEVAPYPGGSRDDRLPFGRGTHSRESRRGTPGRDGSALLAAGTEGFGYRSGEVWVTHVAWSGNVRHLAERGDGGARTIGGGEFLYPGEIQLEPGESYASPWVYFSYGLGLDEASARFHRFLRARPDHPSKPRPVVATTAGVGLTVEGLTALAEASADVGAELFVLGDGWYKGGGARGGGLGDWYVDKTVFPEGLRPFADYVRGLGLEFGMWFAPEMVSEASDLAREHPEWIAQPSLAGASLRLPLDREGRHVLDLTNPDAFAHVEERLHALVEELRPAHVVCDHLRDLVEAGSTTSGRAIGHAQMHALYRLLDGLRASFPGMEVEVRSDGGGRSDVEVLQRAQRVRAHLATDSFEFCDTTGLIVPPELTARDLPAATGITDRGMPDDRPTVAFWGHIGFEWNVSEPIPSAEQLVDLRAWIELHKRYRKLLHTGEVVRSDAPDSEVGLRGVISGNRREALYSCTSPEPAALDAAPLIHLDGLDPARAYRVTVVRDPREAEDAASPQGWWEDGVIVSGRMLAAHGIQAPPRGRSGVVLLRVERAKAAPQRF